MKESCFVAIWRGTRLLHMVCYIEAHSNTDVGPKKVFHGIKEVHLVRRVMPVCYITVIVICNWCDECGYLLPATQGHGIAKLHHSMAVMK